MLELLFLLLPIAAAYGWYMGRRSIRQKQSHHNKKMSRDYFTGLNFLLSNESDKAVDLFISLLDVDDDTIDTHMSLGSLFRKRGELDRAIRIHQNLIARPNLIQEQREIALMELGKDYQAAGFFDRAEEIFLNLVSQENHSEEAETLLIDIYQVTKEWLKAIKVTQNLSRKRQQVLRPLIAHFYCQLADSEDDLNAKIKLLHTALKQNSNCGRALLSLAQIFLENNDNKSCKRVLTDLIDVDIELLPEALNIVQAVYTEKNDESQYGDFLSHAITDGAGASVINALTTVMVDNGSIKQAENLLLNSLYRHPTMRGFQRLMQIHITQAEDGQAKQSLTMLEQLVEQQIKYRPGFRCHECGFPSHVLYWHCPSCKNWGTIKRIKGLDGE